LLVAGGEGVLGAAGCADGAVPKAAAGLADRAGRQSGPAAGMGAREEVAEPDGQLAAEIKTVLTML
jgi:hypothetical protein